MINRSRKEHLKEQIDKLEAQEHTQIFSIIKKYTDVFTQTQTGVLVSSDNMPDECLLEIETLVTFYLDQRKRMEADSVKRKAIERR